MKTFTVYRTAISERESHSTQMKNADNEPQFEGIIWSDGTVTVRWLTSVASTATFNSLQDLLTIHGHPEYGTEIDWGDGDPEPEWVQMVKEYTNGRYGTTF